LATTNQTFAKAHPRFDAQPPAANLLSRKVQAWHRERYIRQTSARIRLAIPRRTIFGNRTLLLAGYRPQTDQQLRLSVSKPCGM
jgi:hypothetical protein